MNLIGNYLLNVFISKIWHCWSFIFNGYIIRICTRFEFIYFISIFPKSCIMQELIELHHNNLLAIVVSCCGWLFMILQWSWKSQCQFCYNPIKLWHDMPPVLTYIHIIITKSQTKFYRNTKLFEIIYAIDNVKSAKALSCILTLCTSKRWPYLIYNYA